MLEPGDVVIWAGINSSLQSDDNGKPTANVGIYFQTIAKHPFLHGKSLSNQSQPNTRAMHGSSDPTYVIRKQIQWKWNEETTKLCKGPSGVANLFDMPDIMGEYVMALHEKLQALAAFEDAADIGATAQHLGRHEDGHRLQMKIANDVLSVISVLRPKHRFVPQNDPDLVLVHTREALLSISSSTSRLDVTWDNLPPR